MSSGGVRLAAMPQPGITFHTSRPGSGVDGRLSTAVNVRYLVWFGGLSCGLSCGGSHRESDRNRARSVLGMFLLRRL